MASWKELVPIVQALADGKTIQTRTSNGDWEDDNRSVVMMFPNVEYRVKPEPEEIYLVEFADESRLTCWYSTESFAREFANSGRWVGYTIKKFREVTDE